MSMAKRCEAIIAADGNATKYYIHSFRLSKINLKNKIQFPSLNEDNEATIEDTEEGNEEHIDRDEVDSKVLQTENSKICKDSGNDNTVGNLPENNGNNNSLWMN